ncbi:hypothetical protein [Photobacterium sp. TY1-4]|uniref:hypothetical protein n=1 Tax=Photobacterium sp. TY1-4 TaxID=2899122 RepID=UPI0021C039B8|nr:hypothetical protein [Photobacterium sp. TY1-4]UXI03633.1 hypothetical protein NH461_24775 [Photobacterium sp. TY1-4]
MHRRPTKCVCVGSFVRQRGAMTLTFTLLLPSLLAMIALALFVSMYSQAVIRAGQASDAASVACAWQQRADSQIMQKYLDYYRPGFVPEALLGPHRLDGTQRCTISAQYQFKPAMAGVMPVVTDETRVGASAQSAARLLTQVASKPTDIALVLDISGSMSPHLAKLKGIITGIIEGIDPRNHQVRFSVVPFDSGVSIRNAPWYPASAGVTKCVDGLSYLGGRWDPQQTVDDLNAPSQSLKMKDVTASPWLGACSETATILPLTGQLSEVTEHVNALATSNSTASYQGLIWGVRTLTRQWQAEWQLPVNHSAVAVQRLVLFTDGEDDREDILNQMIDDGICRKIRDELGIDMRFISFGVSQDRLAQFRRCAGAQDAVYDARNPADLEAYFQSALDVETNTRIVLGE